MQVTKTVHGAPLAEELLQGFNIKRKSYVPSWKDGGSSVATLSSSMSRSGSGTLLAESGGGLAGVPAEDGA